VARAQALLGRMTARTANIASTAPDAPGVHRHATGTQNATSTAASRDPRLLSE
jgi:hypothetical protein